MRRRVGLEKSLELRPGVSPKVLETERNSSLSMFRLFHL